MRQEDQDLLKASGDGDLNMAKEVIEKDANIEAKGEDDGEMPLHIASLYGYESIISLLLKMCIMI
jgi:ankyrin repeat protein